MTRGRAGVSRGLSNAAIGLAIAATPAAGLAQITAEDERRIARQQEDLDTVERWLGGMEEAQRNGNCDEYKRYEGYFDHVASGAHETREVQPEILDRIRARFELARSRGCVPATQERPSSPANFLPITPGAQQAASSVPVIAGRYRTNFGDMTLAEAGGSYTHEHGRIAFSQVEGDTVEGTWTQGTSGQRCADGSYRGRLQFTFTAAGFEGTYGYCDEEPTRAWTGTRDTAPVAVAVAASQPAPPPAPPPTPRPVPVAAPTPAVPPSPPVAVARTPLPEFTVNWGQTVTTARIWSYLSNSNSAIIVICPPADEHEREFYRVNYGPGTGTGFLAPDSFGAVFGGPRYLDESDICHAGVHAGAITWTGGRVQLNYAGSADTAIPGVVRNRVSSRSVPDGAATATYRISKPIE